MNRSIDINADAGESFGHWELGQDDALYPHLTSVNLACGFHAGDPSTMARSVALAGRLGVAVGAHPGFPDLVGFGRRDIAASPAQVLDDVLYQLGALGAFLRASGLTLHHVKAHGALYLKMMVDSATANAVAAAVAAFDAGVPIVVLAGPGGHLMATAARAVGLRVVTEAYPDRGYLADGRLAPRAMAGSVLDDPEAIARRASIIAQGGSLETLDGGRLELEAETLCLHGDNSNAVASAAAVRRALMDVGVDIRAF